MWRITDDLPELSRPDGRERDKFRDILINYSSINTANGSAIVKLGNTTVVSGITFESIELELNEDQPAEELIENTLSNVANLIKINVKFQPHCSFSFKMEGNDQDAKESLIMTGYFEQILKNAKIFNLNQLIKLEDKKLTLNKMNIEILIENYDGNGFDGSNFALLASILDCKLNDKNLKIDNYPISTTFSFKKSQVQDNLEIIFHDPNLDDEKLASGLVNIVINAETNQLILLNKIGGEGISFDNLKKCIKVAIKRADKVVNYLKSKQTLLS